MIPLALFLQKEQKTSKNKQNKTEPQTAFQAAGGCGQALPPAEVPRPRQTQAAGGLWLEQPPREEPF